MIPDRESSHHSCTTRRPDREDDGRTTAMPRRQDMPEVIG